MNSVQWRSIKGFEGIYEVSNFGEVRSLIRIIKNGKNSCFLSKEKTLAKSKTTTGYYKVELSKEGKIKSFKVHRLVAIAFIPNPINKPNINHIDGNVLNNSVQNLNWCTQKENMIHASTFNLRKKKITKEQELELIKLYLNKCPISDICTTFNISSGILYRTLNKHNIKKYEMLERKIKFIIDKDYLIEQLNKKTQKQIAKEIGCDASLISHYAKRIKINGGIYKC